MKEIILNKIDEIKDEIIDLSMDIYNNPEIAMEEFESSKKLASYLRTKGFDVEEKLAGMDTAFRATKKNGEGPKIAICAEYDALPYGHACGHHLIGTMSCAAGIGLAEALSEYAGEIAVIGTPAEEIGEGKPYLIDHNIFQYYDLAMMIHPFAETCIEPTISTIGGYDFTFIGKTSHAGAKPFDGINALDALVSFYNNVSVLRQQLKDGTRIHGIVLEGGSVVNSIPEKAVMRYEVRSEDMKYYHEVVDKVVNCAKAAALATGCELKYGPFERVCLGLKKNTTLANVFRSVMGEFNIEEHDQQNGGSTDMGDVSYTIPAIHPMVKFVENGADTHTLEFMNASIKPFAYNMLINGAKAMAMTGLEVLKNPAIVEKMKQEFNNK